MTQAMRNAAIVLLAFLAGACVRVGHIQQTEPVATLKFKGDHKAVAQCVRERLGAKVQDEAFGERYVLFGAVKGKAAEGLTHYAITVGRSGPDQGFAEWRVMKPAMHGTTSSARPSVNMPAQGLSNDAVQQFWAPVQDCAARAKP